MLNIGEGVSIYIVQRKANVILIIIRSCGRTVVCINFSTDHSKESCKVLIKGIDNTLNICNTPTINPYPANVENMVSS